MGRRKKLIKKKRCADISNQFHFTTRHQSSTIVVVSGYCRSKRNGKKIHTIYLLVIYTFICISIYIETRRVYKLQNVLLKTYVYREKKGEYNNNNVKKKKKKLKNNIIHMVEKSSAVVQRRHDATDISKYITAHAKKGDVHDNC